MDDAAVVQVGHASSNFNRYGKHGHHVCGPLWAGPEPLSAHSILHTGGCLDVIGQFMCSSVKSCRHHLLPAHGILW